MCICPLKWPQTRLLPSTGGPPVYLGLHQTSLSDEMVLHTTLSREVHQGEEKKPLCSAADKSGKREGHSPSFGWRSGDLSVWRGWYTNIPYPRGNEMANWKGRTVKRRCINQELLHQLSSSGKGRGLCSEIRIGMLGSGASDIGEGGGLCCRCSCQGGKKGKYPGLKLWRKMSECSGRAVAGWGGWMTGTGKVFKCFEILLSEEIAIIGRLLSGQNWYQELPENAKCL